MTFKNVVHQNHWANFKTFCSVTVSRFTAVAAESRKPNYGANDLTECATAAALVMCSGGIVL